MSTNLIDPDTNLVEKRFAVIYAPKKRRNRFPENCVQLKATREEALDGADDAAHHSAALVYGPCRSSEGFKLYYLIEWLEK